MIAYENHILITGASSGIGQAVAQALSGKIRGLTLFSRRSVDLAGTQSVVGDIREPADVKRLVDTAIATHGPIDGVINCAGSFPKGDFLSVTHADWKECIDTNLTGYALLCRAVLPGMKVHGHGRIVNITSLLAEFAKPEMSAYVASKAGATQFMKSLSAELHKQGFLDILLNDLIPGSVKTAMNPTGEQLPKTIVPYILQLLSLEKNGPSGKTFFKGEEYKWLCPLA